MVPKADKWLNKWSNHLSRAPKAHISARMSRAPFVVVGGRAAAAVDNRRRQRRQGPPGPPGPPPKAVFKKKTDEKLKNSTPEEVDAYIVAFKQHVGDRDELRRLGRIRRLVRNKYYAQESRDRKREAELALKRESRVNRVRAKALFLSAISNGLLFLRTFADTTDRDLRALMGQAAATGRCVLKNSRDPEEYYTHAFHGTWEIYSFDKTDEPWELDEDPTNAEGAVNELRERCIMIMYRYIVDKDEWLKLFVYVVANLLQACHVLRRDAVPGAMLSPFVE